jgi:hypothetical protein
MKLQAALMGTILAGAIPAWASEVAVNVRGCFTSESSVIDRAGDVVIGQSELRGLSDSVPPGGAWDKTTHHCRSVWTSSKTSYEFSNRCTNVDRDGDKFFTMSYGSSLKSFKWVYLAGTGKYEGITGGGDASVDEVYPRTTPAVAGACWRGTGSYTIKK